MNLEHLHYLFHQQLLDKLRQVIPTKNQQKPQRLDDDECVPIKHGTDFTISHDGVYRSTTH